jgi:hypothetical protein
VKRNYQTIDKQGKAKHLAELLCYIGQQWPPDSVQVVLKPLKIMPVLYQSVLSEAAFRAGQAKAIKVIRSYDLQAAINRLTA